MIDPRKENSLPYNYLETRRWVTGIKDIIPSPMTLTFEVIDWDEVIAKDEEVEDDKSTLIPCNHKVSRAVREWEYLRKDGQPRRAPKVILNEETGCLEEVYEEVEYDDQS